MIKIFKMNKWVFLLAIAVITIPLLIILGIRQGQRSYVERELSFHDEAFKKYLAVTKAKRYDYEIDSAGFEMKFKVSENLSDSLNKVKRKVGYFIGGPISLSKLFDEIYSRSGIDDLREGEVFNYFHGYWEKPALVYFSSDAEGFQRWVLKDSILIREVISGNIKDVTVWVRN